MVAGGDNFNIVTGGSYATNLVSSLNRGDKVEGIFICPNNIICVVVEVCSKLLHLAALQVVDKESLLVCLIACTTL